MQFRRSPQLHTGFLFMDNTESTRTCGQCHREVAEANFALHESHCSRFLCLCPDCNEAVHRDQLIQHREEQHTQVKCSKCNMKMERCQLLDHESASCVERLEECEFCQLEVVWKDLDEHRVACGSRTERCTDCGRYVRLRDQPAHIQMCSIPDQNASPPPAHSTTLSSAAKLTVTCSRCAGSFPAEDIDEHEMQCFPTRRRDDEKAEPKEEEKEDEDDSSGLRPTAQLSGAFKASSLASPQWRDGGDPHEISTCPHCHLALPVVTLRWHKVKCQTHIFLRLSEG